jgi:hypothetical protein
VLKQRILDQETAKQRSRKSLQTRGPLLASDAIRIRREKLQKEKADAVKKAQKALDS